MIKNQNAFYKLLVDKFPFTPTLSQDTLLKSLSKFLFNNEKNSLFVLKGYAGTGKTTSISTIVTHLWQIGYKSVLLAPTGRAAKVIVNYTKRPAFTIHKKIYFPKSKRDGNMSFVLKQNKHNNTIFMVDEASMISDTTTDAKLFENGSLLNDLIQYVYSGSKCKLILIGDTAQLPPVKTNLSPALDETKLSFDYNKEVSSIELNEVMRQHQDSGILTNATELRNLMTDYFQDTNFQIDTNYPDIIRLIDSYEIENAINDAYQQDSIEDTAIIVRSNKRANQYNQQIRNKILSHESELAVNDYIMVVKNNYYWLEETDEADFIANGDICKVVQIHKFKDLYGFRFADITIAMVDYPNQKPFEVTVMLDTLTSETPSLTYEQSNLLYQEVKKDYAELKSKYKQFQSIKKNKYFNALQIKFSYAMTCHKSQGGQWKNVIIEKPYLPNGQDVGYFRWLYTAITRAESKLYLIGFVNNDFYD